MNLYLEEPSSQAWSVLLEVHKISCLPGTEAYVEVAIGMYHHRTGVAKRVVPKGLTLQDIRDIPGEFEFEALEGRMPPVMVLQPLEHAQQMDAIVSTWCKFGDEKNNKFRRIGFKRIKFGQIENYKFNKGKPPWLKKKSSPPIY